MKPIEIYGGCKFFSDLNPDNNLGRNYNLGMWNLILSIRDLKLYSKGIKPHRNWKITPLKTYFGMNGNAKVLQKKLDTLYRVLTEK